MVNYKKLYAGLVGEIDDTLQIICQNLLEGKHGFEELNAVGIRLHDALLKAEEEVLADEDNDA